MVGTSHVTTGPACLTHRQVYYRPCAGNKGDLCWIDRRVTASHRGRECATELSQTDSMLRQNLRGALMLVVGQTYEQMSRPEVVVVQLRCLVLRKTERALG